MSRLTCIISLVLFGVGSVSAATVVFDNEGDFLAAIGGGGGYLLEDFDEYTYGSFQQDYLDLGPADGYACQLSAFGAGDPGLWSGDGNMSTNSALNPILANFSTSANDVYSVGGWFFASDIGGSYQPGSMQLTLSDGTVEEFDPGDNTTFRGFVSDAPLDWFEIEAPDDSGYAWPTMDHFYVDSPEPTALVLLAAAGLMLRRR